MASRSEKARRKSLLRDLWWKSEEAKDFCDREFHLWKKNATWKHFSEHKWRLIMGLEHAIEHTATTPDAEALRDQASLFELVSQYTPLRLVGEGLYRGKCCFHNGTSSGSLSVNEKKKVWYCHGCAEGGDIYSFLMKAEKLKFPEAIRLLARLI